MDRAPAPYYSQHLDVRDPYWRPRSCGMTCVKILLEATGTSTPDLDELVRVGNEIGAYGPSGWIHNGLINVAARYGATLTRAEWRLSETKTQEQLLEEGLAAIQAELREDRPVIVSAIKKFVEKEKFHMVILTGIEEKDGQIKGFWYHDPDAHVRDEGERQFVSYQTFREAWRRMAIFRTDR